MGLSDTQVHVKELGVIKSKVLPTSGGPGIA